MKKILIIVFLLGYYQLAISQTNFYKVWFADNFMSTSYLKGHTSFTKPFDSFQPVNEQQEDFMAVPQWFNLGLDTGGFYISYLNTNVKAVFKPLTEPGNSRGDLLGAL